MAVTKTEAGSWLVDFRDQHRQRIRKTFDRHKDAVDFEKEVLALVAKREYTRPSFLTVAEVAEKWFNRKAGIEDDGQKSEAADVEATDVETESDDQPTAKKSNYRRSSLIDWRNHVERYIKPELGHIKVCDLDVEQVEKARDRWGKRVSPKMVNKVLTTLAAILAMAKRYKWVKDNVAAEAERLKIATEDEGDEVTRDMVYTEAEIGRLIRATEPGTVERLMIALPALTGCRVGEALGASWQHMDLKANVFRVQYNLADTDRGAPPLLQPPKSRSSRRDIELPVELVHELKLWKLKCSKCEMPTHDGETVNLVFAREDGLPYHRNMVSDALDRAIRKAELTKRLTPHGLRHSFASQLLDRGKSVGEVTKLLGHKDSHVTLKIYIHFSKEKSTATQELAASILGS
jgi:integrase